MPKVKVAFIQEFYQLAGKHQIEIEIPGEEATVRDVLDKIPDAVKERLFDEKGEIRYPAEVAVNGRRIDFLDGLDTKVKDGDLILVSPRALFVI
ncbi:MAG: MoaD/ThiS family protein [Desulfurococcales archaeon]|nr:MoaD/ThiS family protein [Desulfurococcales archaeon]MCE4628786.1 MoaD/ThiS family protein [Desulfurococcales archaeon]